MVKTAVKQRLFGFGRKLVAFLRSHKKLSALSLVALLLAGLILYEITAAKPRVALQGRPDCGSTVQSASRILERHASDPMEVTKAYQTLQKNKEACKSKKRLIIFNADSAEYKREQLQYYHDKAISGYMLGHLDQAKKDAITGLKIDSQLSDADKKKLPSHNKMVSELQNVRDGVY